MEARGNHAVCELATTLRRGQRPVGQICTPLQLDPSPEKATVQKDGTLNEVSTPSPHESLFSVPQIAP